MPAENQSSNTYSIMDRVLLGAADEIHETILDCHDSYYDYTHQEGESLTFEQLSEKLLDAINDVNVLRVRFKDALNNSTETEISKVAHQYGYGQDIEGFRQIGKGFRERTLKTLERLQEAA